MRSGLVFASLALAAQAFSTSFLNHSQLLAGTEDQVWFENNIPLIDVPSKEIQDVYYYRWQTYKEHLVYTGAQYGYLSSEFLHPVFYGAPYGGIVAAAGHHITEGRWLRDHKYGQDIVNYWLAGPGQFPKPATDAVNKDTYDWAHEYSFWAANAVWRQYLVTGDKDFAIGQLENLVKQYRGWDNHFNPVFGLYWQVPVWDATEFTAASYESADPYHGGAGYRPTINAYQFGDAMAIAALATLKGDSALAAEYRHRAEGLQESLQTMLWDNKTHFFMHYHRDSNPQGKLLTTREIMGYLPWMFNMPSKDFDTTPFEQLKDPQGFDATYGPTTAERRSKWYMYEADGCCRWDGPSWPFATAQTLTAVENLLNNYPAQNKITSADYAAMVQRYAVTQYKNGKPYVAEAHHPTEDRWMYDGYDHSEDYNHSTFVDNVLAGLLGLRAQADNSLVVNPLVPGSWEYFAVENAAYHGHNVTVIWDRRGTRYNHGRGMRVYVDGSLAGKRDTVGSIRVEFGDPIPQEISPKVNIAANTQRYPQLTQAFASYTSGFDDVMRAIDGNVWRAAVPGNTRWTSYSSPNAEDHFGVDLRQSQSVCDVRLFFYDDGGGVRIPEKYDLQYWTGGKWVTVPDQERDPMPTISNEETRITFPTIKTSKLRVVAPNTGTGKGWGLSEFEVWTAPIFKIRNENSAKFMGVDSASTDNNALIRQYDDSKEHDQYWEFTKVEGGWFKVKNLNSGLLLGVKDASTANSEHLVQYEDTGSAAQLWRVESKGNGLFLIINKNSRKVAGVDEMSTANGGNIVQYENNGTKDHLWSLLPAAVEGCVDLE
ncbi:hypothetical protein K4F52_005248 [Lecanicillium sp. MT-2017a]|nr:hypothetical protein K4F52_005248 [Lecanicillium sp. MT-2017a]